MKFDVLSVKLKDCQKLRFSTVKCKQWRPQMSIADRIWTQSASTTDSRKIMIHFSCKKLNCFCKKYFVNCMWTINSKLAKEQLAQRRLV